MMTITANAASILIPRVCLCRVLRDRLVHMHAAGQELWGDSSNTGPFLMDAVLTWKDADKNYGDDVR
jgi:hypothetical protein